MDNYYDTIAESYNELYKEEQIEKIAIVKKHIEIKPEYKLLDVGCGNAFYLDDFKCECVGIDPSKKLLSQYKGKHKVIQGKAEKIPFQENEFDVVVSFTAIQNFNNIEKGLNEIKRVGKNIFVLTFIKRSVNADTTKNLIKSIFSEFNIKEIKHEKDVILILELIN
jgi:ubiquinone/menaquinone biosynthesis C-methylase UbiE